MIEKDFNPLNEQKNRSLEIVLNQISSFDNKAATISSILGIVFALSFTIIEFISEVETKLKICIIISFIMFLASIITSLIFSVLVLMPRKRETSNDEKSLTYYKDLKKMKEKDYIKLFEDNNGEGVSFEQINENAKICSKKHLYLQRSIMLMIPTAFFFLLTTILIIFS